MPDALHDLPELPVARGCPYEPPEGQRRLRRTDPIVRVRLRDGRPAWLVTGYEQARAALADRRLTADRTHPNSPLPIPARTGARPAEPVRRPALLGSEGPEHTRQRRLLLSAFTHKRVTAMRPALRRIVDRHLDAMIAAGPPADLVSSFALPVPSLAICELLGVPYADHAFFERQARLRHDPEHAGTALAELGAYLSDLIGAKSADPGDGLLDDLIARRVDLGELVGFALVLLIAGHATTSSMISYGTLALLERHGRLTDPRERGPEVPDLVEELLRFISLDFGMLPRVATTELDIGGRLVAAGDAVLVATGTANHDPTLVDHPDELSPHRPGRPRHLSFGHGVHQCLGQNLARAELQIAFSELAGRLPGLRLAIPAVRLTVTPGTGLDELPVTW